MISNFSFLQPEWEFLFDQAHEAEKTAITAPVTSAFYSRLCLEITIHWLYENESALTLPYNTSLASLMAERAFCEIIPPSIKSNLDYIRKEGNNAVHTGKSIPRVSMASVRFLYRFLIWFAKMYSENPPDIGEFDESFIPKVGGREKTIAELKNLEQKFAEQVELARQERLRRESVEAELEHLRKEILYIQNRKERNQPVSLPPEQYTEAQTRELYIDALLREAGWDTAAINATEYPVTGMPKSVNPNGKGYVDYVLWGDNGRPLAVVEAKKASRNINEGKHQAELYANCLENMTGQRPVIFYTNGFNTELWDDCFYPPRKVHGFYTKDELQALINRRIDRLDPRTVQINNAITDRSYQKHAIKSVLDKFTWTDNGKMKGGSRAALVVMATGTGKTRTVISFIDVLFKAGWIRRVLFLADRNTLVTQAKRSFNKLLPNLSSVDLTKDKEDTNTRLVFSTYPTIMNCIDGVRSGDQRFYSVVHFDLIVIDEAHRSVYQKYKAIFEYFDALMLGLTATPKDDTDHDTYQLFEEEFKNPTYHYELDEAVSEGFLVPYNGKKIDIGFMSRGIKYDDLPQHEKIIYEETFRDESGYFPKEIDSTALNNWLFNENTVDKVLDYLMVNGIKTEGGDKIGKSIIFAKSHLHAEFIEKRFNKMYPQYTNKLLRIIDNYEKYAQDLLDDFSIKEKYPQIAVSVDMLDTGIDVPEIVNLVIFKPVFSRAKFWQMIGRGTRTCIDLFAPGQDKKQFNVFDFCGNFDFFNENPNGRDSGNTDSITARIFKTTVLLAEAFREDPYLDEYHQKVRTEYLDWACKLVQGLNADNFRVRMNLEFVEKFKHPVKWQNLNEQDRFEILTYLSDLVFIPEPDELARRFDLLMLNFQLAIVEQSPTQIRYENAVREIATNLTRLLNISEVARAKSLIQAVRTEEFWKDKNHSKLEQIRFAFRDLIKFISKSELIIYQTNFVDEVIKVTDVNEAAGGYHRSDLYIQKVETYIRNNQNHFAIQKLRNNIPLNTNDLNELERMLFIDSQICTKEDFVKHYGTKPLGVFIRSLLGMDAEATSKAFSEFLDQGNLNSAQIQFIRTIIVHFKNNGILELPHLSEPPFTEINDQGLFGLFADEDQDRIIRIIENVNSNAVA
jgi:type I restriction enzyme R subunit